jgi:hypothetical protein
MKLYVLDITRYNGYLTEGLCPNCGHKPTKGDVHMEHLDVNGDKVWGCYIKSDTQLVRPGMLVTK